MPKFEICTLESHLYECYYTVEAANKYEAKDLIRRGLVEIDSKELIEQNPNDEVLEFKDIIEVEE